MSEIYKQNRKAGVKVGMKFDGTDKDHHTAKPQWHLLPWNEVEDIVRVLMFGAKKYKEDNWKDVLPKIRYYDALIRHVKAWRTGETLDPESGLPHLAHAGCCILFLLWHDKQSHKSCEEIEE